MSDFHQSTITTIKVHRNSTVYGQFIQYIMFFRPVQPPSVWPELNCKLLQINFAVFFCPKVQCCLRWIIHLIPSDSASPAPRGPWTLCPSPSTPTSPASPSPGSQILSLSYHYSYHRSRITAIDDSFQFYEALEVLNMSHNISASIRARSFVSQASAGLVC